MILSSKTYVQYHVCVHVYIIVYIKQQINV